MKRVILGIAITIISIVGLSGVYILANDDQSDISNNSAKTQQSESTSLVRDETSKTGSISTSDNTSTPINSEIIEVEIEDYTYSPKEITVKKGTTVKWTNKDSSRHNAFSDDINGPKGGLLSKNESYSFTFTNTGTYEYYCEPHPYMTAKVIVAD